MNELYPLKFEPVLKEKIWGGKRLKEVLGKNVGTLEKVGESWELSAYDGSVSVVNNGFLAGNDLLELVEIYMGDLIGDRVYAQFGINFPLLIKFIDANDYLSVQVHPDDEMALERHNSFGKTEMWYIMDAEDDAELIIGFNQKLDKEKYLQVLNSGKIGDVLHREKVHKGDVFFMPAGRVHATGPGILFAEIQQTSDLTYRIYDWDRVDADGNQRELHTELAIEAIDFEQPEQLKTLYRQENNQRNEVQSCKYFTTNLLKLNQKIVLNYAWLDSFVVFMGIDGDLDIHFSPNQSPVRLSKGETVLVPALIDEITLQPLTPETRVLEVYLPME
ncbi:MAG: type I phosphomannose isomerase catalytic subunit [Salinivirgaceae bacterium]